MAPQIVPSQYGILAVFVVFFVLSILAVALRLISRRLAHLSLWWDDYFVILAMLVFCGGFWADIGQIQYGLGRHLSEIGVQNLIPFLIRIYVAEVKYPISVACNKLSFLFLFLRVFGIDRNFARTTYVLMFLVIGWGIATCFGAIFQCKPIAGAWNRELPGGVVCIDIPKFEFGTNLTNVLLDACIIALPIRRVWKLKLTWNQKLAITGVFLLGFFTTVTSILRTYYTSHLIVKDPTYNFKNLSIWSKVEENLGMICASLPVLLPVLRLLFGHVVWVPGRSSGSPNHTRKTRSHYSHGSPKNRSERGGGGDDDNSGGGGSGSGSGGPRDSGAYMLNPSRQATPFQRMQIPTLDEQTLAAGPKTLEEEEEEEEEEARSMKDSENGLIDGHGHEDRDREGIQKTMSITQYSMRGGGLS